MDEEFKFDEVIILDADTKYQREVIIVSQPEDKPNYTNIRIGNSTPLSVRTHRLTSKKDYDDKEFLNSEIIRLLKKSDEHTITSLKKELSQFSFTMIVNACNKLVEKEIIKVTTGSTKYLILL